MAPVVTLGEVPKKKKPAKNEGKQSQGYYRIFFLKKKGFIKIEYDFKWFVKIKFKVVLIYKQYINSVNFILNVQKRINNNKFIIN